jgi:hypothetical protein
VEIDATLRSHTWCAEEVLRFCVAFNKCVESLHFLLCFKTFVMIFE